MMRMRLLVVTQAVDKNDPVLGFFHRWLEEFAKHTDQLIVVCLREGAHSLPSNVRVYSLGKESGAVSRLTYARRFRALIKNYVHEYDEVFVHMNPEYIVLGGLFWRMRRKRIVLWYVHKSVTMWLRLAVPLCNRIVTASPGSFRIASAKVHVLGHGIDTDFFSPGERIERADILLSVGRLMPTKRHDLAIRAAARIGKELHIIGDGPERARLEALAHTLGANVHFLGGLTQEGVRNEYRKAVCLVHTSDTGSLDKVVLEALACGAAVVTTNTEAYTDMPVHIAASDPEAIADAIGGLRGSGDGVSAVREKHSLPTLIDKICTNFT